MRDSPGRAEPPPARGHPQLRHQIRMTTQRPPWLSPEGRRRTSRALHLLAKQRRAFRKGRRELDVIGREDGDDACRRGAEIRDRTAPFGHHCGSDGLGVALVGSGSLRVRDQAVSRSCSGRGAQPSCDAAGSPRSGTVGAERDAACRNRTASRSLGLLEISPGTEDIQQRQDQAA